jgi:23S rRNA (adenine2503-C2)-methyltransferase
MNLLELTCDQLVDHFENNYGRGAYHAAALYRAFYTIGGMDLVKLAPFAASPQLCRRVERDLEAGLPAIAGRADTGGVTKLVFRLSDGLTAETVIIPMARHTTVCVSSQVGCRMGCRFCETARWGLQRPLSTSEIVAQVYTVKVTMGMNVRNVVFMGMGEPLDNFDQVVHAIRVMEDQRGLNIAKRRITVSTAGLVDGIRRLAALDWPQLKLAVSLNAADDALRSLLMPINRRHNLAALKQALLNYPLARGNVLLIEYVLIKDVNDQPEHARRLADYLRDLPVRLNLIAYNPRHGSPLKAPSESEVNQFLQCLIEQKIFVRLRKSKGDPIWAACGQLGRSLADRGHDQNNSVPYPGRMDRFPVIDSM